jgi:VanZ family protein
MSGQDSRRRWLWPIAYALLILAVSSIPARRMPDAEAIWRMDKLIHATEYMIFAVLVARAHGRRSALALMLTALACAAFGALDESYQSTVPGRDSSALDLLADFVGASFGSALWGVVYSRWRDRHGHHSHVREQDSQDW